jgi:DnaJ like chaperone protein
MSWFGKMLGGTIGLMIGGPLGAIAGGALGHHLFDKQSGAARARRVEWNERLREAQEQARSRARTTGGAGSSGGTTERTQPRYGAEERQAAFFLALFSILGKLAKADGRITREEGEAVIEFLDRMKVTGDQRQFAIRVFNEAKNSSHTVEEFARQFTQMTMGQPDLRSSLVDMLFRVALADQELHPEEDRIIGSVAGILGISSAELDSIRGRYLASSEHAYSVLGLTTEADDEEIKSTYRRLVQEYHPDRIVSQGMPEEFVEYATQRFQEIQNAWEQIKRERGL